MHVLLSILQVIIQILTIRYLYFTNTG